MFNKSNTTGITSWARTAYLSEHPVFVPVKLVFISPNSMSSGSVLWFLLGFRVQWDVQFVFAPICFVGGSCRLTVTLRGQLVFRKLLSFCYTFLVGSYCSIFSFLCSFLSTIVTVIQQNLQWLVFRRNVFHQWYPSYVCGVEFWLFSAILSITSFTSRRLASLVEEVNHQSTDSNY
jgi:hypothetical protein